MMLAMPVKIIVVLLAVMSALQVEGRGAASTTPPATTSPLAVKGHSTSEWKGREVNISLITANVTVWVHRSSFMERPLWPGWLVVSMTSVAAGMGFLILLVGLVILCAVCVAGGHKACLMFLAFAPLQYRFQSVDLGGRVDKTAEVREQESARDRRLVVEALLPIQVQWISVPIALLAGLYTGGQVPSWCLLLVASPLVMRAVWLDCSSDWAYAPADVAGTKSVLHKIGDVRELVLSKLELADAVSDGAACASAILLHKSANDRFISSFASPFLRSSIRWLGGLRYASLAVLLSSSVVQLVLRQAGSTFSADAAGLGLIASKLSRGEHATSFRIMGAAIDRCFAEATPQVLLQTSLLMATGDDILQHPVLLISVCLSIMTRIRHAVSMLGVIFWVHVGIEEDADPHIPTLLCIFVCIAAVAAVILAVAVIAILKVFAVEVCESRMWGPSTGCMPVPSPVGH